MRRIVGPISATSLCIIAVLVGVCVCILQAVMDTGMLAQDDVVTPGKNLKVIGIPDIPKSLADKVLKYRGAYGLSNAGWNPVKRELWVKGISDISWVSRIENPGERPKGLLFIPEKDIYDIYIQPQAKFLIFNKDLDGDENYQMYLFDIEKKKSTLLTDGKSRNTEFVWSNAGDKVVYSCSPKGSEGVSLCLINPFDPGSNRVLVQTTQSYLKAYDWSSDDSKIVYCDFVNGIKSNLIVIDIKSGHRQNVITDKLDNSYYLSPSFSKDGSALYVRSDRMSEFKRLISFDLQTGKLNYLTSDSWDVEEYKISPNGKYLLYSSNEDGVSQLSLINIESKQKKSVTGVPIGVVSNITWHHDSLAAAFDFTSSNRPKDVYVLDVGTCKANIWASSTSGTINLDTFSKPQHFRWKTFDNRYISGFIYKPPTKFQGKRPVVIYIHGGPDNQYRPMYNYEDNFMSNEFGVVRIYPNIRGSTGYGKTFQRLDNGMKREDAIKDVGALLDWIQSEPDLDGRKVMIRGASFGGYIALSVAIQYGQYLKGVVAEFAPLDLLKMVESDKGWRVNIQRDEYGDERDPKIQSYLTNISPINKLNQLKVNCLIIQGRNDPRVPVIDSTVLLSSMSSNMKDALWFIEANDEGHGFSQWRNNNYAFLAVVMFVEKCLVA